MLKKIKQFAGIIIILFLVVVLFIALLTIWDVIDNEVAVETLIKVAYTFGAIFVVSLFVMLIAKSRE